MAPTVGGMGSLPFFMMVMLISGSANTLLMKFMTIQHVPTSAGGVATGFEHPFFQSLLMMVGEFLCLLVYLCHRNKESDTIFSSMPKGIFLIACLFDWTATTLVNMAYGLIAASVVQMTRGAVVIFTCLLSVVFLRRRQYRYHLAGVTLVFIGITLVSLSTFFNPANAHTTSPGSNSGKLLGIGLCIGAQVFQASMLVYEESIMSKYTVAPMLVVGMEGTFGIGVGVLLLSVLNPMGIENTPHAFYQMGHSMPLLMAVIASIFSIAFFNFSGVTVTQQASAVARSTIDVSRTILIWIFELALGWNSFNFLQLAGFVVLAIGCALYNRLLVLSFLEPSELEETAALLREKEKSLPKAEQALKDITKAV